MAAQETLETIEKALDHIEDGLEALEPAAVRVDNHKSMIVASAIVGVTLGLVAGGFAGYKFAKRKLQTKYEQLAQQEIDQARAFYARVSKEETPEQIVERLGLEPANQAAHLIRKYQGTQLTAEDKQDILDASSKESPEEAVVEMEEVVTVAQNIFVNGEPLDDDWDYDAEAMKRRPEFPYIISDEEFLQNEPENEQTTLTYYSGDDVLADASDDPIPDIERTVGEALSNFGHGSKRNNVVFVRNDRLKTDFEILRSDGEFRREVLGYLEHSRDHRPKARRMPRDDE